MEHAEKCPQSRNQAPCTCDGYHTFGELYEHRIALFLVLAAFFNRYYPNEYWAWRSKKHSDGSSYKGWFTLGIGTKPGEQITYHLPMSRWKQTGFAKTLKQAPEFDGHTSDDVIERLYKLL